MITIRKIYKYIISDKRKMINTKRLGLIGLVTLAGISFGISKAHTEGQIEKEYNSEHNSTPIEQIVESPKVIATIKVPSQRPEYKDKVFEYNIWSDYTISRSDNPDIKFAQRWFYDIDGDGQFGKAEIDMENSGNFVYMSPQFNEEVNENIRKSLEQFILINEQYSEQITTLNQQIQDNQEVKRLKDRFYPEVPVEVEPKEMHPPYPTSDFQPKTSTEYPLHEPQLEEPEVTEYHYPGKSKESEEEMFERLAIERLKTKQEKRKPRKHEQRENVWSVVTGIDASTDFVNGSFGVRFESKENLGIGLMVRKGVGSDRTVSEITTPISRQGIYGKGTINESERSMSGIGGEFKLGPFIFGGGMSNYTHTIDVTENLLRNGQVIKPNSYSKVDSEASGYLMAGLEFKLGSRRNFALGINTYIPVQSEQKQSVGLRGSYIFKNKK